MGWAKARLLGKDTPAEAGKPTETSVSFPASGFTFMRSDWSKDARYMLINHGPSGGGHSHADSLSFELHAFGQACAIDSGIGYTYDDPHHRPWYVRTRAHNMLMIDDDDLDRKAAEGRDVLWTTLKGLDFFAATHNGYLASKGIAHRRHIVFVKPDYWLIYDVLTKPGPSGLGPWSLSWNLHSPTPMEQHQHGFTSKSAPGLLVLPASDWTREQTRGWASVRGIRGHEGKDYAEIDWIRFNRETVRNFPATIGVLLFPFADSRPDVTLQLVKQDHLTAHFKVEHPSGVDHVFLGQTDTILTSGDFTFNGECAVIRYPRNGPPGFSTAKTLTLKVGNRTIAESASPADSEGNF
jgi:hypothetical protein